MNSKPLLLFKYGGNAMTDDVLKKKVLASICFLREKGYEVVIVHGGGPFIQQALDDAGIASEFIDGHRKTSTEALSHVEMALKGKVNGSLVALLNALGQKAVGLSGKDGQVVTARKRMHEQQVDGKTVTVDLGQVGDVAAVDAQLLRLLLDNDYIPVMTCIAADAQGNEYNINGDMFAGHVAGALGADQYIVLTDVDGLLRDKDDPASLISKLYLAEADQLTADGVIVGGMIPKIASCREAIAAGAKSARIINGTAPEQIAAIFENKNVGTVLLP